MIEAIRAATGLTGPQDWINGLLLVVVVIFSLNLLLELLVTISGRAFGDG